MSDFFKGFQYLLTGFRWMFQPGLKRFIFIPVVVNIILFSTLILLAFAQFGDLLGFITGYLPSWLEWLTWLIWPIFIISVLMVITQTFAIVGNLLIAPFNGMLAEKTEILITKQTLEETDDWKLLIKHIPQSLMREVQKLIYYVPRALLLLVLFIIPGVNIFAAALWFVFGAWMMAIQYVDYPFDNHSLSFGALKQELKQRRLLALGFGLAVALGVMVPVLNFFVMPAAVIGASHLWVEQIKQKN